MAKNKKDFRRATTPDGIDLVLRDDLYGGMTICAYPIAVYSNKPFTRAGDHFCLCITASEYKNYPIEQVEKDFERLASGEIKLKDLRKYFWYGEEDAYMLGLKGAEYNV